jgi:glutathione S-transferase
MKLYFFPGACSLSPHIALREAGLTFDTRMVNLQSRKLADGSDFLAVNPKGYVPVLELDDGEILTEGPTIVQYIADQAPEKKLAPPAGTMERYRLQEWLGFINSEIHKSFSPLFGPGVPDETKAAARGRILQRLTWVDSQLGGKPYLLGDEFSVADIYLFVVTSWTGHANVDISGLAHLGAFMGRVGSRPAVQAALEAEGLKKRA